MEPRNRNILFIVIAAVIVLCCCALAGVAAASRFVTVGFDWFGVGAWQQQRIEERLAVGASPRLEIDNFAGDVTVQAGGDGEIHVEAIKRGSPAMNLDRIQVEITEREGGVAIRTKKANAFTNASVSLKITAPADTRLDLHTGAGSADVRGLSDYVKVDTGAGSVTLIDIGGEIDAHSGAGSIDLRNAEGTIVLDSGTGSLTLIDVRGEVDAHSDAGGIDMRGASGTVSLDTGTGGIDYEGQPYGDCRFKTGAGSITLRLPADLDMEVELDTGAGSIEVGYAVEGRVTKREVEGTIGSGADGRLYAHTGTGSIDLIRR
jgi:DUF4097 and DUF4098 domain-containing protein YvlB